MADGKFFSSPSPGSTLIGTDGDDTLSASRGADTLTGGAGADDFRFTSFPYSAGHITDFEVGVDQLDLRWLFGDYHGTDPIADGKLILQSDGAGNTLVYVDRDAPNSGDWPFLITTLDHVTPASLTTHDYMVENPKIISIQRANPGADLEGNSGATGMDFIVRRSGPTNETATVDWAVRPLDGAGDPSARASDFVGGAYPSGVLTFNPGEYEKTLTIYVQGDTQPEFNDIFLVELSNPTGAALPTGGGGRVADASIWNDDGQVNAHFAFAETSVSQAEGDSGVTNVSLTIVRSGPTDTATLTGVRVVAGSATGSDFAGGALPGDQSVVFQDGETTKTITFQIAGDTQVESDETFYVRLFDAGSEGYTYGGDATVTVRNDDSTEPPPSSVFNFQTTSVSKAEGDSGVTEFNYVITRTGDVDHDAVVTVTVEGSGAHPADGSDVKLVNDQWVSFAAGETSKTYTVQVYGDTAAEADEGFTLTLAPTVHSWNTTGPNRTATGLIQNDDDGSTAGQVIISQRYGDTLQGGSGDDTLLAGRGPDQLTGGGGDDVFIYRETAWNAGAVTDFAVGADRLDLHELLEDNGYTGSDPVADGWVRFDQRADGAMVLVDTDGPASGNTIWFQMTTLKGLSAGGLTWADVSGGGSEEPPPPPPPPPPDGEDGQMIVSPGPGSTLTGTSGDDTLVSSRGSDVLIGAGGADRFVFPAENWSPADIRDFVSGVDKIDLRGMFDAIGYSGTDPFADGYLKLIDDGAGGTKVLFDHDASGSDPVWPNYVIHVTGVAPGQIGAGDWIFQ